MLLLSKPWAALMLASVFYPTTKADDCSVDPLVLPIKNVTFPNGIGANRGVKVTLGGQVQGMRMSTILNNTRVRNILDCPQQDTLAFVGCQGASGSVYDTTKGSFSQVLNLKDWNVTTVDAQPADGITTVLHGYETANFTDGPAVTYGYPFEVWADFDSMNKSALALGPDSSTISLLVKQKHAPTSSWSLDYGSTSELYPRDGQIVFGGLNEARFNETKKTEFNMWGAGAPVNCPLQVLIADIILTNDDGDHSLFTDVGTRVSACIDTVQNDFTFTPNMFSRFQNFTNHTSTINGSTFGQSTYPASLEPKIGTLTIKLTNGYTTVIPHYELVTHERGTDSRGRYAVTNNTHISATVSSGMSDLGNNVPILGGVFLSQNYLHVDYQAGKFWLSPQVANGTLPDHISTSCNGTSTGSTGGSALGLKVGIPVAIGAAVVFLVALWFWMKNRKRNVNNSVAGASRSIPRSEKRDAPDSKSSTTRFAGYPAAHHANPDNHMELEGDLATRPAELEEPAPAYSRASEWPRMNSIQGENMTYYRPSAREEEHVESYELADTSPNPPPAAVPPRPPPKRQDTAVSAMSDSWTQSPTALQKQISNFSDVVSPTSTTRANSTRRNPQYSTT
ncbi:aspartic-type endopeptidase [Colletotrichum truncatum]|uniref:Aspartic-type endopeptidase n=1 Tax=Colletotrichum truncatum TaxID=5467 RepID=A0ACC3ZHK5_COLTU|nr:aspartic-type endopeptidase [Colletotrichum truncatum]KAF6782313.1 aspartic-type endopeptidase [Colletotrichum truncatum]